MKKSRTEVIAFINTLEGYDGYVQFSHRPINLEKDVFNGVSPKVEDEEGFVYEAHFCKENESIMIRQINADWLVSITDISNTALETFHGIADLKVNMAQIWKSQKDKLCENMDVMKLEKVVFAGFKKDEK